MVRWKIQSLINMLRFSWVFYDLAGLACSAYLSHTRYFHLNPGPAIHFSRSLWCVIFVAFGIVLNYLWELYEPEILADAKQITTRLSFAGLTLGILIVLVNYVLFFPGVGRVILSSSVLGALGWELGWRSVRARHFRSRGRQKVLIAGNGELVDEICSLLASSNHYPYVVAAIASSDGSGQSSTDIPLINLSEVSRAVEENNVKHILMAPGDRPDGHTLDRLIDCMRLGVRFHDACTFYEQLTGRIPIRYVDHGWFLSQVQSIGEPLFRQAKRTADFLLALLGMVVTLPLGLIIALAIRLDSPGPVLFRQRRVGLNGRVFNLVKFRTMVVNAEKTGPVWAASKDLRVTRVGSVLRRLRLDELPQCWNILTGEMSFVGPRPERPEFVEVLRGEIPFYGRRHLVRPGLTGWAQVRFPYGASIEDARHKFEYDLYYVKNQSLVTDLLILGRTVSVVLGRRGSR
ncbi:MAG: sugar transferase [Acidobacteriia bacterium]|nr:sugar transferase [Terriglobia bacterium]